MKASSVAERAEFESWNHRSKQVLSLRKTLENAQELDKELQDHYFVASDDNQIQFISDMEQLGRTIGVKSSVDDLSASSDYSSISGSITLDGTWPNIFAAVGAIENYPYQLDITDLTIAPDGVGQTEYRANLHFVIRHVTKPSDPAS